MNKHTLRVFILAAIALMGGGCASFPMQSPENDARAKCFDAPPEGLSGLYLFRDTSDGSELKKLYVDGQYLGKSAHKTYFHRFMTPGRHLLQTESGWGENEIEINAEDGKNHFVCQKVHTSIFNKIMRAFGAIGGLMNSIFCEHAVLHETSRELGEKAVRSLKLAKDMDDHEKDLDSAEFGQGKGSFSASDVLDGIAAGIQTPNIPFHDTRQLNEHDHLINVQSPHDVRLQNEREAQTAARQEEERFLPSRSPVETTPSRNHSQPSAVGATQRGGGLDTASRLQKLDELRAEGVVSPEEYARKRAEIIDSL